MDKLTIRVFGNAELIRFRTFSRDEWDKLLIKNNMNSDNFIEQMYDPDFYIVNNFPNYLNLNNAKSKIEFFGNNYFYGPLYNQMALVEIKFARKKLFRGTLNKFLGKDTFFSMVDLKFDYNEIEKNENFITICSIERTTGQVVNLFTKSTAFNPDYFSVNIIETKLGEFNFKLMSGFNYNNHQFKTMKLDQVVRKQWGFLI